MSRVEAIGWRDDVSSLEHTPEQLSHECRILTCLFGQFFGTKGMVRCLQDLEYFLSLKGEGCACSQEGRDRLVIRAEPLDGRDTVRIGDDLVDQVASFFTEVVFDGDEQTLVFVGGMLCDEQAGASRGDDTDGAATPVQWVLGAAFIEVANDQESTVDTLGHEC